MKRFGKIFACILAIFMLLGSVSCAPSTEKIDTLLKKWETAGKISYSKSEDADAFLNTIKIKTGLEIDKSGVTAAYSVVDETFHTLWIIEFDQKSDARKLCREKPQQFYGNDEVDYTVKRKGNVVFLGSAELLDAFLNEV